MKYKIITTVIILILGVFFCAPLLDPEFRATAGPGNWFMLGVFCQAILTLFLQFISKLND